MWNTGRRCEDIVFDIPLKTASVARLPLMLCSIVTSARWLVKHMKEHYEDHEDPAGELRQPPPSWYPRSRWSSPRKVCTATGNFFTPLDVDATILIVDGTPQFPAGPCRHSLQFVETRVTRVDWIRNAMRFSSTGNAV